MKYAIDKIEDDIIVLENLDTKELKEVSSSQILGEPHEGAIVLEQEKNYIISETEETKRRQMLKKKLERLKNLKKSQ